MQSRELTLKLQKIKITAKKLILRKKTRSQKTRKRNVDTSTKVTANIKRYVDSHTQVKFAKSFRKEANVIRNLAKTDIQRSANGHKERVGVKDKIVITSMLHLYVMMGNRARLTIIFYVLVAKACSKTRSVLYSML